MKVGAFLGDLVRDRILHGIFCKVVANDIAIFRWMGMSRLSFHTGNRVEGDRPSPMAITFIFSSKAGGRAIHLVVHVHGSAL